ncbi:hypothetical protein BC937DRAFT_90928 [Endogone sp. FLAS-F59071]|nr:hypothetical protein BC937DRAFT_90928 [Endogone sp. FLAS-F59071]|eukprot:RUS16684.1 hypothetical protein BC937DRAFT_90928 [Endogone sp. FLAS-F59071]
MPPTSPPRSDHIPYLPTETLQQIFSYLPPVALHSAQLVSCTWNALAAPLRYSSLHLPATRSLRLLTRTLATPDTTHPYAIHIRHLSTAGLTSTAYDTSAFARLLSLLPCLDSLAVSSPNFLDIASRALASRLRRIELVQSRGSASLDPAARQYLERFTQLEVIILKGGKYLAWTLHVVVTTAPVVKSLVFCDITVDLEGNIDVAIQSLAQTNRTLIYFHVARCPFDRMDRWVAGTAIDNLVVLVLGRCMVSEASLGEVVGNAGALKYLILDRCSTITTRTLRRLADPTCCPQLVELSLVDCRKLWKIESAKVATVFRGWKARAQLVTVNVAVSGGFWVVATKEGMEKEWEKVRVKFIKRRVAEPTPEAYAFEDRFVSVVPRVRVGEDSEKGKDQMGGKNVDSVPRLPSAAKIPPGYCDDTEGEWKERELMMTLQRDDE